MVVAIVMSKWSNFSQPFFSEKNAGNVKITLSENVIFANKARIQKALNEVAPNSTVTIDGTASKNVHPDVVEIINDFRSNAVDKGITVEVINL